MITRIDHVQVAAPAGGEGAARAFYGDLLGLAELPKPQRLRARGGVWFAVGGQQLHVGIEGSFAAARKAHPALAVPRAGDLSALAAKLEAAGREIAWDGPRFYVEDPFGNRPAELPALVAEADGERAGLATYRIEDGDCELVTLDALTVGGGIGGALVEALADTARAAGCARLHLVTTNDNLPALRLHQRHGVVLAAVRLDGVAASRRRKPQIPATGHAGIPIRDELVLERAL